MNASLPARVLFVFLDGVGIGEGDSATNPFLAAGARTPALLELFGGEVPTCSRPKTRPAERGAARRGVAFPLSATLDVAGTPQSGTGQVALLTGESAAEIQGRHFGPWTPVRLRPLVEKRSVLARAARAGRVVAFANAYPRAWPGPLGSRGVAAPPLAARAAGVLDRHEDALAEGRAVASELTNEGWRCHLGHAGLPRVTEQEAGRNLARVAAGAELTLFAHYATDAAGHARDMRAAVAALERLDAFFRGLFAELAADTLLVVASDHGNLEDVRAGHTLNPALGAARGPGAERAAELADIREVTPLVLELLGVRD